MNLLKQKSWAVVIIDENEDSKEIKIINLLKENNYNVVGINLNNYKSDKFHVYESLKDIPHNVDIVAIIKESIHNYCIIDEMELLDIKNIYFEKGSYTEYILKKAKEAKLNIVNFVDLYEELKLFIPFLMYAICYIIVNYKP